jgi:hypothetical protein
VVTSEAAADAARRRRRRQTEQESAAAAPPVALVEAKLVSAVEAKPGAAQVTTVEAVAVAPVAEAALPRNMPKAKKIERKNSFDRQMKFLLKAEQQQEEAPL